MGNDADLRGRHAVVHERAAREGARGDDQGSGVMFLLLRRANVGPPGIERVQPLREPGRGGHHVAAIRVADGLHHHQRRAQLTAAARQDPARGVEPDHDVGLLDRAPRDPLLGIARCANGKARCALTPARTAARAVHSRMGCRRTRSLWRSSITRLLTRLPKLAGRAPNAASSAPPCAMAKPVWKAPRMPAWSSSTARRAACCVPGWIRRTRAPRPVRLRHCAIYHCLQRGRRPYSGHRGGIVVAMGVR